MFTGIVETVGIIKNSHQQSGRHVLTIIRPSIFNDIKVGDSIAVNGVCLTMITVQDEQFVVEMVPETLRLTNLCKLAPHDTVNLERAMAVNSRFGGHYVQGHVDGMGSIIDIQHEGDALIVKIAISPALSRYVVNKGYITLDGMSITVIAVDTHSFAVTFIPHTQKATIISRYQIGSSINIEVDLFGKYVEKLVGAQHEHTSRTSNSRLK